jgi:hypothetical protein
MTYSKSSKCSTLKIFNSLTIFFLNTYIARIRLNCLSFIPIPLNEVAFCIKLLKKKFPLSMEGRMKKINSLLLTITLQIFISPFAHANLDNLLERIEKNKFIKKTVSNIDVKANVNLVNLDLGDIAFLNTKYRYDVEPSFVTKGYLRTDGWKLTTKLSAGDYLEKMGAPLYFDIDNTREIIFVRQFKKQTEALTAIPILDFKKIPISAIAAKENLLPGEFISLPVTMNIVVGSQSVQHWSMLKFSANAYMGLSGSFNLQALRMDQDRIRIRIIADRNKNAGIGVKVSGEFDLLEISPINNAIEKIVDVKFLDISRTIAKGDVIIADYIFNLNSTDSMAALDAILANPYHFRPFQGVKEIFHRKQEELKLISNLDKAERLYKDDLSLPTEKRRVQRMFLGKNSYLSRARNIKVGTNLFNIKSTKGYNENKITYTEENGTDSYFYFPTFSKNRNRKILWNLFRESEEKETGVLFVSNRDFSEFTFTDYVMNLRIRETHLFQRELIKLKARLFNNMPDVVTEQFRELDKIETTQDKATIHAQIVFNSNAYLAINGTSYEELKVSFDKYAKAINDKAQIAGANRMGHNPHRSETEVYSLSIKKMLETLAFALNSDGTTTKSERINALVSLRNNRAFDKFGIGFIMSLLTEEELRKYIQVSLSITTKDLDEPLIMKFGNSSESEFYDTLLRVRAIMGLDLLGLR